MSTGGAAIAAATAYSEGLRVVRKVAAGRGAARSRHSCGSSVVVVTGIVDVDVENLSDCGQFGTTF